jgi:ABC-type hemin transport system substrate-binding protein
MNRGSLRRSSFIVHRSSFVVALFVLACGAPSPSTTRDDLGRAVSVPARVGRVVSLAPNVTEIVYAVGAGGRLVGTDDASNFPPPARALPKVGGMQPNIERIAALHPDLVIASTEGNHPSLAPALAAAGIALFVVRTDRLAEVGVAMQRLGDLLGAPDTARAVRELEQGVAAERRARPTRARVLFLVWTDPLYVAGSETFTDDLLTLAGAENAVTARGWPQYSLEALVAQPPDLILYPRGAVTPQQIEALRARAPGLTSRVVAVDEDVFQRPGPRVVRAARSLNAILDER